jgi:hypothetical protein
MSKCRSVPAAALPFAAAMTILAFSAPAAATTHMPPRPENTSRPAVVVERVEVRVPVDDTAAEIVQMQLAAAVAAVTATALTRARSRRRQVRPAGSAVIDITDPRIL